MFLIIVTPALYNLLISVSTAKKLPGMGLEERIKVSDGLRVTHECLPFAI
jgi:hypothetical protein